MRSMLRDRLGIPGVISVVALVFAMLGGAYAASGSGGGHATASAKPKRGPTGPKGPKGATGPAGAQGGQGPAGQIGPAGVNGGTGEKGATGAAGAPGTDGADGESVVSTPLPIGDVNCPVGGSEFEATSVTYACNGKDGEPWTAGGVLPKGATETGGWAYGEITVHGENGSGEKSGTAYVPLSFSVPLSEAIAPENVHFLNAGETTADCSGSSEDPKANEGHLCVYATESGAPFLVGIATKAGATLLFSGEDAGLKAGYGTFAVTGS
jgi:hypothetical protein